MFRGRVLAAAAATIFLFGCGSNVRVFAKPAGEVHKILAALDDVPPVFGGELLDVATDAGDPSRVVWVVRKEDAEVMRFVATLQPVQPDRTRVELALTGPTSGAFGNVQQRLEQKNEVRDFYLAAMNEQIASEVEEREFDITRTYAALGKAMTAEAGDIAAGMDAAPKVNKHDDPHVRERVAEAEAVAAGMQQSGGQ